MSCFSYKLDYLKETVTFEFGRIHLPRGSKFFIRAVRSPHPALYFTMENRKGKWTIVDGPKVPEWLLPFEPVLAGAIRAYIQQH